MTLVFESRGVMAFIGGMFFVASIASAVWSIRASAVDPTLLIAVLFPTLPLGVLAVACFIAAFAQ